jgi:nickel/cobalt exporter
MKSRKLAAAAVFLCASVVQAHPMGNFSVSHYARIEVSPTGARIRYALDLAEIPTFQLLQEWKLEASSPREELERRAGETVREWVRNLRPAGLKVVHTGLVLDKGAGGMPILRVTSELEFTGHPGMLRYEDLNYPERAGWKEIVITAGAGTVIDDAAPTGSDRSAGLTAYPQDPLVAPPQDLRGSVKWHAVAPATQTENLPAAGRQAPGAAAASVETAATPHSAEQQSAAQESAAQPGQSGSGMVVRGDYLSRLLHQGEIGWGMMIVGMLVAFGLGAVHALSPGHGKTIVAAYLVGSRGTPRHALFLGGMVTFTHTISVFFLGLTTLFLSRYVLPEKIYPVLGAISGISIVWIGATLLYKRIQVAMGNGPAPHPHHQHHHHPHTHEGHDHASVHDHGDGHVHNHMPEDISMAGLIALGASGGLVPCPSALVLLLSSVALGRVGLGLTLLVAFSAGLAVVLSGIGLVVLYARNLLPDSQKTARHPVFRYLPVASAAIIVCAGILMTGVALGVIRPFAGI